MIYTKEIEAEMAKAVQWLADRGGSGVQDRYGHVVARGETAKHIAHVTWSRCVFAVAAHPSHLRVEGGRIWTPAALDEVERRLVAMVMHEGSVR